MRLIFTNCYRYNAPESDVVFMAKKLEEAFEIRFSKMPNPPQSSSSQQTAQTNNLQQLNIITKQQSLNDSVSVNTPSSTASTSSNSYRTQAKAPITTKRRDSSQSATTLVKTVSPKTKPVKTNSVNLNLTHKHLQKNE